jgi:bifunctional oligoribonuclease and PAP phosphatase NrnA
MNSSLNTIVDILKNSETVVILGHTNPDGDAVNACYALAFALDMLDKKPIVVLEAYNDKYNVSDGSKFLYKGDIANLNFDLIVSLDSGSTDRLGAMQNIYENSENSICIDHHISNTYFGKYNYVMTHASSTCEIVYDIVKNLVDINKNIGSAIYAGLIFDTGGFRHDCTNSKTHMIASEILKLDIPFNKIYNQLMIKRTPIEAKIYAKAIQKMNITINDKIAYTYLTKEDFEHCNATTQHLDGIVEFLLSIDTTEVALFAYEKSDCSIKISMRSKDVDVSKIAGSFGGGGHKLASGCTLNKPIEEAIKVMITTIERELNA